MRWPSLTIPLLLLPLFLLSCSNAEDQDKCLDTRWRDSDNDGYGDAWKKVEVECGDTKGTSDNWYDCDDENAGIYPGGPEYCNGIDDNCDNWIDGIDSVDAPVWYPDFDLDGYGDPVWAYPSCLPVAGYVLNGADCDDSHAEALPGGAEVCDGVDNDCDGETDEPDALGTTTWYVDVDGDGYGASTLSVQMCAPPYGYVDNDNDCYDLDRTVYPGAAELDDDLDNDCDGDIDELSGSLRFDGTGDSVWIDDNNAFDLAGEVTFEAWVSCSDTRREAPVLAKEHCGTSSADQFWFGVQNRTFGMKLGGGTGWSLTANTSGSITGAGWTHIASVWDGENWYNYQDGELVESGTWSGTIPTGPESVTIGLNSGCDSAKYSGSIADVRFWDVARTEDQLTENMWLLADTTGLVARWRLDDGSGQVVRDSSGNGLDGRLGTSVEEDDRDPTWSSDFPEL